MSPIELAERIDFHLFCVTATIQPAWVDSAIALLKDSAAELRRQHAQAAAIKQLKDTLWNARKLISGHPQILDEIDAALLGQSQRT